MKKLLPFFLFMTLAIVVNAQSRAIYVHPKFYSLAKNHKTIAVLPFSVSIGLRPDERKKITEEELTKMEEREGIAAQNALESWFLKKQKSQPFEIQFQDVQTTNAILTKNNVDLHDLSAHTPQELAQILGVDAIMGGSMQTTKPVSEGATIAVGLAFGLWSPTNSGNVTINLNNAADGTLLWKYDKQLSRGLGSDMNLLMDTLMRKASRQFPYLDMEKYREDAMKH